MRRTIRMLLASACLSAILMLAPSPAAAVERVAGDFYTYEVRAELMGLEVTGELTYRFEGTDAVTLDGTDYAVNVMSVTGTLSGGVMMVDLVEATVDGTAFETSQGMSMVKEEVAVLVNVTFGTGQFAQVYNIVEEFSSTQSPPLLSGFDPSGAELGDEWSETVTVRTVNRTWLNGDLWGDPVWTNETIRYNVTIADETDRVVTEAGDFECMRMSVESGSDESYVLWWSPDVGNFVRVHTYSEGGTEPIGTVELVDYLHDEPSDILFIILVGGSVLAVSIVVLVVVLILMRRGPPQSDAYGPELQLERTPDDELADERE